ncbi:uncharacterized protein LAJ45_03160 [Morchella importuna]|uniref:uncharacterized protein n=1 Tax=Morchella importuna TaxID=1174673 RepID=UPI001E8E8D0C|nr:uncharacterized protein LAJ45_03160 [Morchella importuna]KAH8152933.1 hypothetical protein LAJ45_03160 [Morchella importuna]
MAETHSIVDLSHFDEEDVCDYRFGGYHPVRLGDIYNNRYKVVRKLGYGQNSTVWLALDLHLNRHVALKILTSRCYGGKKEVYELAILQRITNSDVKHPGWKHVLSLLDSFVHTGPNGDHVCLANEMMLGNLHELSFRFGPRRQLPVRLVKEVSRQMLSGLQYLHETCGVIHSDLKPANILISIKGLDVESVIRKHLENNHPMVFRPDYLIISDALQLTLPGSPSDFLFKIADFGNSSWVDNHLMELIQPVNLRAPEVIIGAKWDTSTDIWNIGCVIFELLQGRPLFRGRTDEGLGWTVNEDRLALMMDLFGPLPKDLLQEGKVSSRYFDDNGNLSSIRPISNEFSLERVVKLWNPGLSEKTALGFVEFLKPMLEYRPKDRRTARQMLDGAWLQ